MYIFSQNSLTKTNFCAMKPNQFSGVDYAVVRKYKAPVEKFKNLEEFQNWAKTKFRELETSDFSGRKPATAILRKLNFREWKNFFERNHTLYSPPQIYLLIESFLKDMKAYNDLLFPAIREPVVVETFAEIDKKIQEEKDCLFNPSSIYKANLRRYLFNFSEETMNGWIIFPSQRKAPEEYSDNVERLKILSSKAWCTRSYHAEDFLKRGDFHVYLEKGVPKLAIRFSGCAIAEIQSEKNNFMVPSEYKELIIKYIKDNNFYVNDDVESMLELSENK